MAGAQSNARADSALIHMLIGSRVGKSTETPRSESVIKLRLSSGECEASSRNVNKDANASRVSIRDVISLNQLIGRSAVCIPNTRQSVRPLL